MLTESQFKATQEPDAGHSDAIAEQHAAEREELSNDVASGIEAGAASARDDDDFASSAEWFDKLDSYRPGKGLELMQELAQHHEAMARDPVNGGEAFAEWCLRNGIGSKRPEAPTQKADPSQSIRSALEASLEQSKKADYRRGSYDFFRSKFPGESFATATKSVADFFDRAEKVGLQKAISEVAIEKYNLPLSDEQRFTREETAAAQQELAAFTADPRYPRARELAPFMADLVQRGASLHDAYKGAERIESAVNAAENTYRRKYSDYDKVKIACLALVQKKGAKDFDDAYRQVKAAAAKPARKPPGMKNDPSLRGDIEAAVRGRA